jgi:hypothetical protein
LLECSSVLVVAALPRAGTVVLHDPNKVLSGQPLSLSRTRGPPARLLTSHVTLVADWAQR